jgi:hypothetical protein
LFFPSGRWDLLLRTGLSSMVVPALAANIRLTVFGRRTPALSGCRATRRGPADAPNCDDDRDAL